MGLDDIDGVSEGGSSRSSPNRQSSQEPEEEIVQTFSHAGRTKKLNEEQWEKAKKVIRLEMDYTVEEVVNNLPSGERYELIHEALTWNSDDLTDKQEELKDEKRCIVCGKSATPSETVIEVEDYLVHFHHTVAQLGKALRDERGEPHPWE